MLFNTLNFAIFLPIVYVLYYLARKKSVTVQNLILLLSSYFFYACWDWRFLFLLVFSTVLDYFSAIKIEDSKNIKTKKIWLWISILINLGFLGAFKYYNFFIESIARVLTKTGVETNFNLLNVVLPVGISFYTFHGLSYIIDIYKNRISTERNFIDYSLFVSFFPLLVAGPIERATHLLPQLKSKRNFSYDKTLDGLKQIFWGLFKKIVIADKCAQLANPIFDNFETQTGSTLFIGAVLFTFQIYGDFSGYSDIALGTARLFGIELLQNFNYPYFSRNISEFWRRWHISLSSWFKDYVYIPLGGSKSSALFRVRNTLIIFLLSGFWHGANWTFMFWGFLNALYIMPQIIFKTNRNNLEIVAKGQLFPNMKDFLSILFTFNLTVFAWIFFRSNSISRAFNYCSLIFSKSFFSLPSTAVINLVLLASVIIMLLVEWQGRENNYGLKKLHFCKSKTSRWAFYYLLSILIFYYSISNSAQTFIYFQF